MELTCDPLAHPILCQFLSLSLFLSISLCHSFSLSFFLSLSLSLFLSFCLSFILSYFLSLFLSLSISASLSLSLSLSLSIALAASPEGPKEYCCSAILRHETIRDWYAWHLSLTTPTCWKYLKGALIFLSNGGFDSLLRFDLRGIQETTGSKGNEVKMKVVDNNWKQMSLFYLQLGLFGLRLVFLAYGLFFLTVINLF